MMKFTPLKGLYIMASTIQKTIGFLQKILNDSDKFVEVANIATVEVANIATLNDGDEFLESTHPVVMSIINIEEDRIMQNPNVYVRKNNKEFNAFSNPVKHLNIYVLFTAYSKQNASQDNLYLSSITKLEQVIRFFQNQCVFENGLPAGIEKIILEMKSLKIEDLNQMWSFLGNRYMPSVLYKIKMLAIESEISETKQRIDKVDLQFWDKDKDDLAGLVEASNIIDKSSINLDES